ncbi:MAG TPA: C45 family peptidase [Noviherbaspirillum sp.]|nr:C45 family peptidase [Noviherbaspirillum sp.]
MERVAIEGTAFTIGESLGQLGRPAADCMTASADWAALDTWRGKPEISALMERTRDVFPQYWEELRGMSAGLGMDMMDVFLWNCRADLLAAPDTASSSVVINRLGCGLVVQKPEVALPLAQHCKLVDIKPEGKPGFLALFVPGCIPGQAFAVNYAGVVQVVDAIPGEAHGTGLPSWLINRAVLDAQSLPEAIDIVMECQRFGAAHHILASTQEFIIVSIEATSSDRALAPIPNKHWHTNHLASKPAPAADMEQASRSRYASLKDLLARMPSHPTEDDLVSLLDAKISPAGAGVLRPAKGEIGTALIKIQRDAVELRLFRIPQRSKQRHLIAAAPGQIMNGD